MKQEMTAKQTPLEEILRMCAEDLHGMSGYNQFSKALSQGADEIDRLRATIERLREYARHQGGCERHRWRGDVRRECDCGYDDLIKELEETK